MIAVTIVLVLDQESKWKSRVRVPFRDAADLHAWRVERNCRQQAKWKWKRALQLNPVRQGAGQEIPEATITELTGKEWGDRCYPTKKGHCRHRPSAHHTFCCKHGGCLLQIQRQGQGRGRLTEESAISLRVQSDPTAKIILESGEMVTQL